MDDLEVFMEPVKVSAALNYDYLDEVVGFMQHFNGFPAGHTLAEWEKKSAAPFYNSAAERRSLQEALSAAECRFSRMWI